MLEHVRRVFSQLPVMWDGLLMKRPTMLMRTCPSSSKRCFRAHGSPLQPPVGLRWKQICTAAMNFATGTSTPFHFIGGIPVKDDGSMALYESKGQEVYLQELTEPLKKKAQR